MLDQLRPNYIVKFCFRWNLLKASNKYFGARRARDLRTLGRELGPNATFKERACLVQEVTIAATDLQKIATSQSAFGEIMQEALECCSQREFLSSVAGVRISACAPFIIGRLAINLLHRCLGKPRKEIVQSAFRAARHLVRFMQTKRKLAPFVPAQRTRRVFKIFGDLCGGFLQSHLPLQTIHT